MPHYVALVRITSTSTQLHMDDPDTPLDEVVEAMDQMCAPARLVIIGVSNFLAYRLARALGRQDTLKLTRFVSVQPRYNLLVRDGERELFPLALEDGIAVIPFNPLAGGLLTGKYKFSGDTREGAIFERTRPIRRNVPGSLLA